MLSFIFSIFQLTLIQLSLSLITLPFIEKIDKSTLKENNLIDILDNSLLTTKIKIGTPNQEIPIIIKSTEYAFHISNESCKGNAEKKYINTLSSSYKEDYYCYDDYIFENDNNFSFEIKGKKSSIDNFYLSKEKNEYNKLYFLLSYNLTVNESGILGMKVYESRLKYQPFNFIKQLKQYNVIKNYIYSFNYNNYNEGNLIIGEYPHQYNSKEYNIDNLKESKMYYSNKHDNFDIRFNKIYYGENKIDDFLDMEFTFDFGLIKRTDKFKENIENFFFNKLIEEKKCDRKISEEKRLFFFCNNKNSIKKFESIKFNLREELVNLTLLYNDLFYKNEKDGKYYFLIYFNVPLTEEEKWKQRINSINNRWILGRLFLKRFLLIFDQDKRIIGFYNNKLNQNYFSKGTLLPWILVFICICIIFVLIFYIFSIYKKIRRKRVNELDLIYDYIPYKN